MFEGIKINSFGVRIVQFKSKSIRQKIEIENWILLYLRYRRTMLKHRFDSHKFLKYSHLRSSFNGKFSMGTNEESTKFCG